MKEKSLKVALEPKKTAFAPSSPSEPPPPTKAANKTFFAPSSPSEPPPSAESVWVGVKRSRESIETFNSPVPLPTFKRANIGSAGLLINHDAQLGVQEAYSPAENSDEEFERELQARAVAIELAGGEEVWDSLAEEETDSYMAQAKKQLGFII